MEIKGGMLLIRQGVKSQIAYAVFVIAMFAALLPIAIPMALAEIDDYGLPIWFAYLAANYLTPVAALTVYRELTKPIPCAAMID